MFRVYHDKNLNKVVIETDDPSVRYLLEFKRKVTSYNSWLRRWETKEIIDKLYENRLGKRKSGIYYFVLGNGWTTYIMSSFKGLMSQSDYDGLLKNVLSETYRDIPFPNLRDYQNQDMLFILKYKRAVIQTNTSYGKTQCICTLVNYAVEELGEKVLIVTPGKKALDEILKRYESLFGVKISPGLGNNISYLITSGFLNRKDIKDPILRKTVEDELNKFDWVIVDELAYTINNSGKFIYNHVKNAKRLYGFDATADKIEGKMISFARGINETVMNNKDLVSFFGPSIVYRMPTNISIDYINLYTKSLDNIVFSKSDFNKENNVFLETMSKIWTNPGVCNLIVKLVRKFPKLFIPVNDLNNIIYNWINNYFIPNRMRVLLICFEKYLYYDENGETKDLDLSGSCEYVKNNLVDVIVGTSSSFKALDISGMESILLISSVNAGSLLQQIGRCARGSHMNIITLCSKSNKKIPIHTKNSIYRYNMIHNYYCYSKVVDVSINEDDL